MPYYGSAGADGLNLGFSNQMAGNNSPYRSATFLPTSLNTMGFGQRGGANTGSSAGMTLSQMLQMQREENAKTQAQNEATRQATLGELGNVGSAFRGDPLWNATRQSAQNMLANPEAINDQTQQMMINRGSNLVNAASNTARGRSRQQLAGMGLLDSSAEQDVLGQTERDRMAQLTDMSTGLDIERAKARNADILRAQQMGAALAGQESGVNQFVAGTRANTDQFYKPEDLSGYAGLFANQAQANVGNSQLSQLMRMMAQQQQQPQAQAPVYNIYGQQGQQRGSLPEPVESSDWWDSSGSTSAPKSSAGSDDGDWWNGSLFSGSTGIPQVDTWRSAGQPAASKTPSYLLQPQGLSGSSSDQTEYVGKPAAGDWWKGMSTGARLPNPEYFGTTTGPTTTYGGSLVPTSTPTQSGSSWWSDIQSDIGRAQSYYPSSSDYDFSKKAGGAANYANY